MEEFILLKKTFEIEIINEQEMAVLAILTGQIIESNDIPILGVGESSLPQIKTFFDAIGVEESEWMEECNAVYKYGNIKTGWDKVDGKPFTYTF